VRLRAGQRLVCRDQITWRVFNADGDEVASGDVSGAFPVLSPGANPITLSFANGPGSDFRAVVKTTKVY
jgi:hypothetical protein